MRVAAAVLGLLVVGGAIVCAGCGFKSSQTPPGDSTAPDDAPVVDAPLDGSIDGPSPGSDACVTFSQRLDTCGVALTAELTITAAATYNTDTHELRENAQVVPVTRATIHTFPTAYDPGDDVDAILVHNLTIKAGVVLRAAGNSAFGALPLAIVASGTVTLENGAMIDVSAAGAGAIPVCSTPPDVGTSSNSGSGGGGGGSYGDTGGHGGSGSLNGTPVLGGKGGDSVAMPPGLRGGCPGARGGVGTGGTVGQGGPGGGAVFIVAAGGITLGTNATLQAGGGGGLGGRHTSNPDVGNAGGGGGGSGGMIALESPHIMAIGARITANGGGGGEGSTMFAAGNPGASGLPTTLGAAGGTGGSIDGGDGGQGGALAATAGATPMITAPGGGGGGGGSVGYIHIVSANRQLGPGISPAPVLSP